MWIVFYIKKEIMQSYFRYSMYLIKDRGCHYAIVPVLHYLEMMGYSLYVAP